MFGFINSESKGTCQSILLTTPHSGTESYTWNKPSDCKFLFCTLIGAGGAGGAGRAGASGGGGGGGGGGAVTSFFMPGAFVPKTLHFRVGVGGRTAGAAGAESFCYVGGMTNVPATVYTAINVMAYARGGTGGGTPTGTPAGAAGLGGTNFALGANATRLLLTGMYKSSAGNNGAAGSTNLVAPVNFTNFSSTSHYVLGGLGGGGYNGGSTFFGGASFDTSAVPDIDYPSLLGGLDNNARGKNGSQDYIDYTKTRAFKAFGGSGGSGADDGTGGNGGSGIFGSGGGGGGSASGQAGTFGAGGDGAILIVWW